MTPMNDGRQHAPPAVATETPREAKGEASPLRNTIANIHCPFCGGEPTGCTQCVSLLEAERNAVDVFSKVERES